MLPKDSHPDEVLRRLGVSVAALQRLCQAHAIDEFAFFGSVLTDRFGPSSDIDVLIRFRPGHAPGLIGFGLLHDELSNLFGRRVDIATRPAIERSENAARRDSILSNARVVYAA